MPFSRPTLSTLRAQARADVAASIGAFALLRFQPEAAFADAQAAFTEGLYGYLDYIAKQSNPYTATDEWLEAWAGLVDVFREPAIAAAGTVTFSGTDGSILPSGTAIVRADGIGYTTTASGAVAAGTVTVPIVAAVAGLTGNTDVGTSVSLDSGSIGIIATSGSIASMTTAGVEQETDDAFRTRMLERYRAPPQGGATTDYIAWAKEVAGVTRAWAKPNGAGAGTVVVYIMLDDVRSGSGGFPTGTDGVAAAETRATAATGDKLLVADYIYPLRPATALVYVVAPIASPINYTINDLNDAALRPAIIAVLSDMIRAKAELEGTIYPSDFTAAIEAVPGVTRFSLPVPAAPVTAATGHIPTLGTPTWG